MLEIERDSNGMILAVCEWDIIDGRTLYIRELEASRGFVGVVRWAMRRLKGLDVDAVMWTREYEYPGREYKVYAKQACLRRVG